MRENQEVKESKRIRGVFIMNASNGNIVADNFENKVDAKERLKTLPDGDYVLGKVENMVRTVERETNVKIKTKED